MKAALVLAALAASALGFGQAPKHWVVIEVNVPGTIAYGKILGSVSNLMKAFAPEHVEVEIVCEGVGIDMLLRSSKLAKRVTALHSQGVSFVACGNTLRGLHIQRSSLASFVSVAPAGIAEVVRKQEAGWSYLKGAY